MDAVMKLDKRWIIGILMALGVVLGMLLLLPSAVSAKEIEGAPLTPKEYALRKLREAGLPSGFVSDLEKIHVPDERDRVVEMNVLGFLGKADYSGHYSKKAIKKCLEFIRKHRKRLRLAEAKYGVPKEVIAALLWVETKHGTRTGSHNVGHVYFSLLQADHADVLASTIKALALRAPASIDEHKQKVIDRSIAKSNWALTELKSLSEIHRKSPSRMTALAGSYAGAFGIPQFIPSSYLQWARPSAKEREPNLFNVEDAIQSVAFYLNANGWKKMDSSTHQAALFHYNRAQGYVDVILKIAKSVKESHVADTRSPPRTIQTTATELSAL